MDKDTYLGEDGRWYIRNEPVELIGVGPIKENEDGSAEYKFHFDDATRDSLAETGLKLVLYCGAAEMDIQKVFDWIKSNMGLTEYEQGEE